MADETQQTSQSSTAGQTQQSSQSGAAQGNTSATQTQSSQTKNAADGQTSQTGQTQQAQAPVRPAYVAESHWDAAAGKIKDEAKFAEEITANAAAVAAERSRRLTLPQKPEDYKDDLPSTFTPPAGLEFKIDTKDPLIAQYRALAHKAGLDQSTYSEGLGLIAALRVGEASQIKQAYDAEVAKLGAAGPDRVAAVNQWIEAVAGEDSAALRNSFKVAPVAGTIITFEKLIKHFQSQGVTPFNQAHRNDAPADGKIPGYKDMSFEQRRFAQDQQRARATR